MATIDYTKFKVEVYSPDGTYITTARINSIYNFYCQGLVPGQNYSLVFSYDGYYLMTAAFTGQVSGKVVYLSPAHFIFNKGIENPCGSFENLVKDKYKFFSTQKQPLMLWQKKIFEILAASGHPVNTTCQTAKKVVKFKAGNDLAGKVR